MFLYEILQVSLFVKKTTEAYSDPRQTSKAKCFTKIVNEWKTLTILKKDSILDVWLSSECASGLGLWLKGCFYESQHKIISGTGH